MTKDNILKTLIELKNSIKAYEKIKYESTDERKDLYENITLLYGKIKSPYLEITGNKNIEVPVAGSNPKSKFNNYFEAGFLSGRTIHSHQGYTELISVIGSIESMDSIQTTRRFKLDLTTNEKIGFAGIILLLVGGVFSFGMYFGNNRFDQVKIDLTEENKNLKQEISIQEEIIQSKSDSLVTLSNQIKVLIIASDSTVSR